MPINYHHCSLRSIFLLFAFVSFFTCSVSAQLRVVTYNTNTFFSGSASNARNTRAAVDTVIQAIGEESVNGIRRAPDIILLQEQQRPSTTTQNLADRLNAIYGAGVYAAGEEVAFTSQGAGTGALTAGEIRQSVVYRTDTVELISEDSFGFVSGPVQPRETLLHQFRPVGYGADADLQIFNAHFEAGSGTGDLTGRFTESVNIRDRADSLGPGANIIVAGDLNIDSGNEDSFQRLTGDVGTVINGDVFTGEVGGDAPFSRTVDRVLGDGQVFDPVDPTGARGLDFSNNSAFARYHTQSPCEFGCDDEFAGGGVDDRFDFILTSSELLDEEGVAFIEGTYRTFGNNGSTFNDAINAGNTIEFEGITSFTDQQVLNALESASDHLPVVADFQLPAILGATLESTVPLEVTQGEEVSLDVLISNLANVDIAIGADELNFFLSTDGSLIGDLAGIDAALGDGVLASVLLDTSVLGDQIGTIEVTTSSFGAPQSSITIPVSFRVVAVPEPSTIGFLGTGLLWLGLRRRKHS